MAFGGKQFYCQMSSDHELANKWYASYITIWLINCYELLIYFSFQLIEILEVILRFFFKVDFHNLKQFKIYLDYS